jgi:hypothetical protein
MESQVLNAATADLHQEAGIALFELNTRFNEAHDFGGELI